MRRAAKRLADDQGHAMSSNSSKTVEAPASPMVPFEDAWRFIIEVGRAAHRCGSTL